MKASLLEMERLREELDAQIARNKELEQRNHQLHNEVRRLGGSGTTSLAKIGSSAEAFKAASALACDVKMQHEMYQAYEALEQMESRIESKIRVDVAKEVERELAIILKDERQNLAEKAAQLMAREIELDDAMRRVLDGFSVSLDSFSSMSGLQPRSKVTPPLREGIRAVVADTAATVAESWQWSKLQTEDQAGLSMPGAVPEAVDSAASVRRIARRGSVEL